MAIVDHSVRLSISNRLKVSVHSLGWHGIDPQQIIEMIADDDPNPFGRDELWAYWSETLRSTLPNMVR